MSKEAKFTCYFIGGLACLLPLIFSGCKHSVQGYIYHEGILHTKTNCETELRVEMNPEYVIVETRTYKNGEYGERITIDTYKYVNDGKYTVERKECEH